MNAKLVIRMGRSRSLEASTTASKRLLPWSSRLFGEFDNQDSNFHPSHEDNKSDLSKDIIVHAAQPDSCKGGQHAHRHDEDDAQG